MQLNGYLVSEDTVDKITSKGLLSIRIGHKRAANLRIAIHTSSNLRELNLNEIAINHCQEFLSLLILNADNGCLMSVTKYYCQQHRQLQEIGRPQ